VVTVDVTRTKELPVKRCAASLADLRHAAAVGKPYIRYASIGRSADNVAPNKISETIAVKVTYSLNVPGTPYATQDGGGVRLDTI
jgi:hypothetical protein